jgi:ABC-type transport system substrate-binding protein
VLRLSSPAPYILNYINSYGAQILPKHLYAGKDVLTNPLNSAPVGTGPFVFKEWVKGSCVRLARNPSYWGQGPNGEAQPYLDGVVVRFIPDAAALTVALEAGEIDTALASTMADVCLVPQLESARRFKLDIAGWPRLFAIDEACGRIAAFRKAVPACQRDA